MWDGKGEDREGRGGTEGGEGRGTGKGRNGDGGRYGRGRARTGKVGAGMREGKGGERGKVRMGTGEGMGCLLYTSPSPRDRGISRMPSSA